MSDDADRAEERIEASIDDAIAHARHMLEKVRMAPCMACHYCGEYVKAGVLFCCQDCRLDYEHEQERKKAQGR